MRASVAMATYNGEKYLSEQIDSILSMMGENDELVISDDGSSDNTWNLILQYSQKDKRVVALKNECPHGVLGNFSNAILACKGEVVFLADQDDIWVNDKINVIMAIFQNNNVDMVVHNGKLVDSNNLEIDNSTLFDVYNTTTSPFKNFIKCTYSGCCMAISREMLLQALPFPTKYGIGHDMWCGIYCGIHGKITLLNHIMILHRIHGENATPVKRRPIQQIVLNRLSLAASLLFRKYSPKGGVASG